MWVSRIVIASHVGDVDEPGRLNIEIQKEEHIGLTLALVKVSGRSQMVCILLSLHFLTCTKDHFRLEDSIRGHFTFCSLIIHSHSFYSFQKALSETKWKEYFSGGRKYYYNVCRMRTFLINV